MERRYFRWRVRWILLALGGIGLGAPRLASAQSSPPPASADAPPAAASGSPAQSSPPPASADTPPAAAPGSPTRTAQLEERIRQLEAMVNKLSTQMNQKPPATAGGTATPDTGSAARATASSAPGRVGAPGQSLPPDPPPAPRFNMPATIVPIPGKANFGNGFEISTNDNEYQMQFHDLTQVDYRGFQQGGQINTRDTFLVPRQWFIFAGRLTKPFEYFVSISNTIASFNYLWCWGNIHYDDRLQFKFGRVFAPFGYEWYFEPTAFLINPERSLWTNSFTPATDIGAYAWGQLFKKRVDYAVGIFNGSRNATIDFNNDKDLIAFLNFRPFLETDIAALKYLNVGGSVDTGHEFNAPVPPFLQTNVQTGPGGQTVSTAAITPGQTVGPTFLTWNSNVRESGWKALWNMHAAYYYNHLSLIAEWQTGFQDYAFATTPRNRTRVPLEGFYVQAGYFLTGETVSARNIIQPKRNFDIRKGKWGPGAIELAARYSLLDLGGQVFRAGLADPNLWTNRVYNVDVGVNWYWTRTIKWYFGWEHDVFAQPVLFAPGRRQSTSDQAWVRFQIFF